MSLNKVLIIGNVGNVPEVHFANEKKVVSLSIATTDRYKDRNTGEVKESTEWHTVVCWDSLAETVEKYVNRGSQVFVEGKLRTRQWTDQAGNKRYNTEVTASTIQLLGKKPENANNNDRQDGGYNF